MEKCLEVVNNNGKFQRMIIYISILTSLLTTVYTLMVSFLTKNPDFFIIDKTNLEQGEKLVTYSKEICDNSKYEIRKDPNSIHNWSYEFDLYCDTNFYISMIIYTIFIGCLIGTIFLSPIPDKYGRKTIFTIVVHASLILHINLIILKNPIHTVIINFLGGISSFAYNMGFYIIVEFIRSDLTGTVLGVFNGVYPLFGVFLGFFFLTINNFRIIFIITTILSIILSYLTYNYFTESPFWLHSMGKKEECLNVINFIADINNRTKEWNDFKKNHPDIVAEIGKKKENENKTKRKSYNIIQILKFPSQRRKILLLAIVWFSAGMNFFGIILNLGHMEGNFFLTSILSFTGEVISEVYSGILADKKGRIFVMKYASYMGSISFLIYKFVGLKLKSIFVMGGMFGYAAIYSVICIYVPENFPPFIRGNVSGFLILLIRFAPMFVPFLTNILDQNVDYIFIILGFVAGFTLNFLDETLGKPIPENIPEEEDENLKIKFLENLNEEGIKLNDIIMENSHSSHSFKIK